MPSDSDPEKRTTIRPRMLLENEKESSGKLREPSWLQELTPEKPDEKQTKPEGRPRQTGVKFQAKAVTKPLSKPGGEMEAAPPAPLASPQPEGRGRSPVPDREAANLEDKKAKTHTPVRPISRRVMKRVRLVVYAFAAGLAAAAVCGVISWKMGFEAGVQNSLDEETKERVTVSKEFLGELDQALADLRAGNTDKAVKKLQELEKAHADVASLTYLLAMAAVQNGDIKLAEAKTAGSIEKRERISDSLALQAVLETQKAADKSIEKFGDPRVRSEALLRQSMLADAANPFPMIELATLLRYEKRNEEALALLRGARSRLNPVDSHTVIDVTIGLSTLENTPDSDLPQIAEPGKDQISAFSAAYIAMRKGDFDQAAGILKTARKMTAPDLFDYLINDPAIRRYVAEPKLKEFFQ